MKKIISFAAALLLVAGAAAFPMQDISVAYADNESSCIRTISSDDAIDKEKEEAEKMGKNLIYSTEAGIVCKDETFISSGKSLVIDTKAEKPTFTVDITHDEIVKLLNGAGKTIDDFDAIGCKVSVTLPENLGVDRASRIMLGGRIRWDEINKEGKPNGGQSVKSFLKNGTLEDTFELSSMNYKKMMEEAEYSRLTFIVENAAVYAHADRRNGDINGDGVTNVSDISMLAAHVKGKKDMYAEQQKYADINGDGRINVSDIALVAKIVKGLS
jgi:hypothetical protein